MKKAWSSPRLTSSSALSYTYLLALNTEQYKNLYAFDLLSGFWVAVALLTAWLARGDHLTLLFTLSRSYCTHALSLSHCSHFLSSSETTLCPLFHATGSCPLDLQVEKPLSKRQKHGASYIVFCIHWYRFYKYYFVYVYASGVLNVYFTTRVVDYTIY